MHSVAAKTLEVRGLQKAYRLPNNRTAPAVRDFTLRVYAKASEHAESRGIILADTKFEFGWHHHQPTDRQSMGLRHLLQVHFIEIELRTVGGSDLHFH